MSMLLRRYHETQFEKKVEEAPKASSSVAEEKPVKKTVTRKKK